MITHSFESLRVWQDARQLALRIYSLARDEPLKREFNLSDQICRATLSIVSNIAEGHERGSSKEFARFLRIARGSAAEVRAQLYTAEDLGVVSEATARALRRDALAITKQITALISVIRAAQDSSCERR
jgi:four helix bundle protein